MEMEGALLVTALRGYRASEKEATGSPAFPSGLATGESLTILLYHAQPVMQLLHIRLASADS